MIDYDEIAAEIKRLEYANTTYDTLNKLAMLYTVQNNKTEAKEMPAERSISAGGSEFVQAARSINIDDLLNILDEHFECIKILYPTEYELILRRIGNKA